MLQISSGKFYKTDELHINDGKGILYSNYSWIGPIETCVGTIEPADTHGEITSYVFSYKNKLEKGGILVRVGDHEVIEQFKLIFSFFFQAFSDIDRNVVEMHCRKTKRNMNDEFIPNDFANRIFESKIYGTEEEIKQFQEFMRKIIGLERSKYKKLIQCLDAFNNSLLALNYNYELAYSLLIYCLESLSQSFDNYEPEWDDYSQTIRLKLNQVLSNIESEKAEEIRDILLTDSHLKLQKRFVNFISSNIDNSFFMEEAAGINLPLKKSALNQVLINAYDMRSKYVHSLQSIMKQLKMPGIGSAEVYTWRNNPFITYKGLIRLTHHVIKNFFENQDFLEKEEYDWNSDLPGVIQVELSEEYWLANCTGFKQEHSTQKLNGFLSQLQNSFLYDKPVTDLTELMKFYEKLIPQSKHKYKLQMLASYILFNLMSEKVRSVNYESIVEKHSEILNQPSIEALLTYALVSKSLVFTTAVCEDIFKKYEKRKYKSSSINIPSYIEFIIMLNITNAFHAEQNTEKYQEWLDKSIMNLAGNYKLQEYLSKIKESNLQIDLNHLISNKFFLSNSENSTTNEQKV
ncbi:hypothetical protein [Priestia megaterium]|uniref:hypothetical protein n=1 Tax=Priestia megaterium TaxID=1404 RepID=UPI001596CFA6|nr:hypothetical protein [Priestia megaterium]